MGVRCPLIRVSNLCGVLYASLFIRVRGGITSMHTCCAAREEGAFFLAESDEERLFHTHTHNARPVHGLMSCPVRYN